MPPQCETVTCQAQKRKGEEREWRTRIILSKALLVQLMRSPPHHFAHLGRSLVQMSLIVSGGSTWHRQRSPSLGAAYTDSITGLLCRGSYDSGIRNGSKDQCHPWYAPATSGTRTRTFREGINGRWITLNSYTRLHAVTVAHLYLLMQLPGDSSVAPD